MCIYTLFFNILSFLALNYFLLIHNPSLLFQNQSLFRDRLINFFSLLFTHFFIFRIFFSYLFDRFVFGPFSFFGIWKQVFVYLNWQIMLLPCFILSWDVYSLLKMFIICLCVCFQVSNIAFICLEDETTKSCLICHFVVCIL